MTIKNYYRIMLGRGSIYAKDAFENSYIGAGWLKEEDLTELSNSSWAEVKEYCYPRYMGLNPKASKAAASLSCGMLNTICFGIKIGDIVLCPDGSGSYWVGEVTENYCYMPGADLPHRRQVQWYPNAILRFNMSGALQRSTGSIGTVSTVTKYSEEIDRLIGGNTPPQLIASDELVEDPTVFALEKHLEDFLVSNWAQTELGENYDIVEDEGEMVGQQYPSDTGPIDILAISKDKKEYLVVELKKGRASDAVVGQIQRYMGFVLEDLSEPDQTVRGVIIALEDDLRLKRALQVTSNIDFYKYQVSFKLFKD